MNKELTLLRKSIMYKIISLGYPAYIGDNDEEFLIAVLKCSHCSETWSMSRSECMFCGTENPHIYQCRICKKRYSITRTSKECCGNKLVKICANENCITNTIDIVRDYFDKAGGVFEIDRSGATLNEMRCKKCGEPVNEYSSILMRLVPDINSHKANEVCLISKKDNLYFVKYNGQVYQFNNVEEIVKTILEGPQK